MALMMRGITKAFGANLVLKKVDFALREGEICALIGENGAGKSTLMNILGGSLRPDAGQIELDGREVRFSSPRDSLQCGIAFIHQELNLVGDLSVADNLFLGRELRGPGGLLNEAAMRRRAEGVFGRMGIPISPTALVGTLDASYKQVVEIARALLMDARIIIMDEPTTSLTEVEIGRVFELMRTLRRQGVSIVFISHKLQEVMALCDRYAVLRNGELVASGDVRDVSERLLARDMVGHEVGDVRMRGEARLGEVLLEAVGLSGGRAFRDISFQARAGEVLGFTGLLGDGRSELFRAVFGLNRSLTGRLLVNGRPARMRGTWQALSLGIGYLPRDRKEQGIVKDMSVLENGTLATLRRFTRRLLIDHRRERAAFRRMADGLRVRMTTMDQPITSLSGGNQQKVVLAKWLLADPRILILDNPTQGVDVGAKEEIYEIILKLADRGVAVIVLSSEAQEIMRVCDRALVMYHGRMQGELSADQLTENNIMLLATGGHPNESA
ncbi:MAG: sugar ABC transporter ATP-binding protein [Clostridiales bacterium]|nr:sugar ABC transporter ATP-binding protein [Clostridiales bacterium]